MNWFPVTSYYLRYNVREKQPIVGIYYSIATPAGTRIDSQHLSVPAADASYLADMLRNEKPVYFDPKTGALATGHEPVGEGEIGGATIGGGGPIS